MKIGISTGGGDCPGLNAVVRAVTLSAIKNQSWEVLGIQDGFEGLIDTERTQVLSIKDVDGILGLGGTVLGTTNRGNPFKYVVEENGEEVIRDISDTVVANFHKLGLDALILVGGDGTQSIGYRLFQKGLPIVGIPKTIDNDLLATDATIGYNTALAIAVDAIDRLHTTARSHHRALVVEVMGRYAGWIALEAGLAGAVDIILIPEIPFEVGKVCNHINKLIENGKHYSITVIAEGAVPLGGRHSIIESEAQNLGGVERLGGIGNWLSQQIEEIADIESRCVVLGHLQRGGPPSHADRLLATRMGTFAVDMVKRQRFGRMVALKGKALQEVDVAEAVDKVRLVRKDSETVLAARDIGISFGD
ncbi:MAG: ATP-dependent 6-phosphofructokinase [Bacteroidetes bacterium]|nr:ATP-dependent 6-phosphofructokinase [Bacteroidota bacterium]